MINLNPIIHDLRYNAPRSNQSLSPLFPNTIRAPILTVLPLPSRIYSPLERIVPQSNVDGEIDIKDARATWMIRDCRIVNDCATRDFTRNTWKVGDDCWLTCTQALREGSFLSAHFLFGLPKITRPHAHASEMPRLRNFSFLSVERETRLSFVDRREFSSIKFKSSICY